MGSPPMLSLSLGRKLSIKKNLLNILSIVLLFDLTAAELLSPQLEYVHNILESNRERRAVKQKNIFLHSLKITKQVHKAGSEL